MERDLLGLRREPERAIDIEAPAALIARAQLPSGEIPWCAGQKTDPWDHVEAAMALGIAGRREAARAAFQWLAGAQLPDGSWYSAYLHGRPLDRTRDANLSAYVAVGVYHHYLLTGDGRFLAEMWETVRAAIDFALGLQAPQGEIHWAISPHGRVDRMALLTGSSSIFMSIKCALAIAAVLGRARPDWQAALRRLGHAIRFKPHLFNVTKSRFSMDWFYPVLCGALTGEDAGRRIERGWRKFVVEGLGARCVTDQPWVTLAETSELVLTLTAVGRPAKARIVFGWISERRFDDGSYWSGFTFPDMTIWPEDRLTWTNAGVIVAADALFELTPAAALFSHRFWSAGGRR
ncbi:MAG TPA: phenyltransferase domain-containing protein [Desulfobacterales bacterium]|nr:phenyltransferase domain-containing protein [Desulfobacterales bacterium]